MARSHRDFTQNAALLEAYSGSTPRVAPKVLDIHPARSVVDVGCNIGVWLRAFVDRFINRFRSSGGEPRGEVLSRPLTGDDHLLPRPAPR
jgi:hypothetical protein